MARDRQSFLGVAIRDISRLREVAVVVAKHGFGGLLRQMPFAKAVLGKIDDKALVHGTPAERFAKLLGALGPTYIKLGQVLSMRADLLPSDYIRALSTLQDQAPPILYSQVVEVIEAELGEEVDKLFAEIEEEPIATASVGQAHVAKTHDGQRVVVKVQRPGIDRMMRSDLDLLFLAARGLEATIEELKLIQPAKIVEEFERNLLRELNFTSELANLLRMKSLLDPDRPVTVPEPLPELSGKRVLTMAYFDGKSIRDLEKGSDAAKEAIEHLVHTFCSGVFTDGFFHGDPHAGNILIDDDGQICLIDLGLVGTLSPEQRDDLVTLVLGVILDDSSTVARIVLKMGTPTQRVDIAELKREIERARREHMTTTLSDFDAEGFLDEFMSAVGRYRVKLNSEYSVLVKAAGTIEGLVRHLHPKIDVLPIVKPYVEEVFADRWKKEDFIQHALGGSVGAVSLLRALPTHADQVLHDIETGNVQIRPITPQLDRLPDTIYQSATRLAVALFASSMTVAAAMSLPDGYAEYTDWAKIAFFLMFAFFAIGGWTVTWWWHWLGKGRAWRLGPLLRFFRRR